MIVLIIFYCVVMKYTYFGVWTNILKHMKVLDYVTVVFYSLFYIFKLIYFIVSYILKVLNCNIASLQMFNYKYI